jgi:hypothetical protein
LRGEHCGSARLTDKASTGSSGAFSQWRGNFFATKLFMMGISLVWGIGLRAGLKKPAVLRRMSWSRRVIALATAYAIALSGLLASFGAAQVTAEAFAQPGGVLCHNTAADQPASHDGTQGKICVDDCCLGCLTIPGTLPPPPAVFAHLQSSTEHVATLTSFTLVRKAGSHYHRSRAPPAAA